MPRRPTCRQRTVVRLRRTSCRVEVEHTRRMPCSADGVFACVTSPSDRSDVRRCASRCCCRPPSPSSSSLTICRRRRRRPHPPPCQLSGSSMHWIACVCVCADEVARSTPGCVRLRAPTQRCVGSRVLRPGGSMQPSRRHAIRAPVHAACLAHPVCPFPCGLPAVSECEQTHGAAHETARRRHATCTTRSVHPPTGCSRPAACRGHGLIAPTRPSGVCVPCRRLPWGTPGRVDGGGDPAGCGAARAGQAPQKGW